MTRKVTPPTDARPWVTPEAARRELARSRPDTRLLRFMELGGWFGPGPSIRDLRAQLHTLAKALENAEPAIRRLPPHLHQALTGRASEIRAIVAQAQPNERAQTAADMAIETANRNGWPRPTPRVLALLAIACGLEPGCSDARWAGSRLPTWKRRQQRATRSRGDTGTP